MQAEAAPLLPLRHAAGVAAFSGPFPVAWTVLRMGQTVGSAEVEGRDSTPSPVDQPTLLRGSWVAPGGVVVEAGFAGSLGIGVGDRLDLGGTTVDVVGIAVTAAIPAYPNTCGEAEGCFLANGAASHNPGLVWATQADAVNIAGTEGPQAYFLNLRLDDPASAPKFAAHYDANTSPTAPYLITWQQIRDGDAQTLAQMRTILTMGSWLLALLAVASVVVLVGGRMAEQTRRVGLLKAVGGTPWLVAVVLLFEHALVGLCAAGVGLLVGWLAAPLIDGPGAGLLGAAGAPSMSGATVAATVALALGVAILATFVPAVRAARQSTVAALNDSARKPARRRRAAIRLSAHLPAPLLLGVRLVARRPRRLLLSVFSLAVTVSGIVALMTFHATSAQWSRGPAVTRAITIIAVMLLILTAVNAAFIAWTTVLDTRHPAADRPSARRHPQADHHRPVDDADVSGSPRLATRHPRSGSPSTKSRRPAARPCCRTTLSLVALVVLMMIVIAVFIAVPTRIGARRSAVQVLQSEVG